jgi:hypothetical protein
MSVGRQFELKSADARAYVRAAGACIKDVNFIRGAAGVAKKS